MKNEFRILKTLAPDLREKAKNLNDFEKTIFLKQKTLNLTENPLFDFADTGAQLIMYKDMFDAILTTKKSIELVIEDFTQYRIKYNDFDKESDEIINYLKSKLLTININP